MEDFDYELEDEVKIKKTEPFLPMPTPRYAGFWVRFGASMVDGFILAIPVYFINVVLYLLLRTTNLSYWEYSTTNTLDIGYEIVSVLVITGMYVAYYGLLTAGSKQGTFGKQLFGIKVVGENGQRISFLRAVGRYFAYFPSSIAFGAGFIAVGISQRKQGWHDMLCQTYVVEK